MNGHRRSAAACVGRVALSSKLWDYISISVARPVCHCLPRSFTTRSATPTVVLPKLKISNQALVWLLVEDQREVLKKSSLLLNRLYSTSTEGSGPFPMRPQRPEPDEGNRKSTFGSTKLEINPAQNLDQLVFQLQMDLQRLKRIHLSDLNTAIGLFANRERSDQHSTFLLSCCGSVLPDVKLEDRNQLVDRLWALIVDSGCTSVENFEAVLKVHTENSHPSVDPLVLLETMKSGGLKLSKDVYHYSLLLFCQRGDIEAAVKVLTLMKTYDVGVGEKDFNALILGNARTGDLNAAKEILQIMKSSQLNPSVETYTVLMQTLIEAEKLEDLKATFAIVKDNHNFLDDSLFKLLKVAAVSNSPTFVDCVIEWFPHAHVNHIQLVNTIKEITVSGQVLMALKVVKMFSSTLRMQGESVGGFFIRDMILANEDAHVVLKVCSYLLDEGINEFAFSIATDCSYRHQRFDLAMTLLEEINRRSLVLRPHYFLPLIINHFDSDGLEGLVRVLEKISSLNVPLDWNISYEWIIPRLLSVVTSPLEAARILKVSSNASYSSGTLSGILACLVKQKRISEASLLVKKATGTVKKPGLLIQLLTKAILEFEQRDHLNENLMMSIGILKYIKDNVPLDDKNDYVGLFITRISRSVGAAAPELWDEFLKGLTKANVTVSEGVVQTMQSSSRREFAMKIDPDLNDQEHKAVGPRQRNEMDTAALESHVKELTSKSMNTRGALRSLFLKYCQSDDLQKALDVKSKFEMESAALSDGMNAALMGLYVRHRLLEPARAIYSNIKESPNKSGEHIDVDFYKILDLATLLLENNVIEEAVALVEKDCLDCPPPVNPKSVTRNVVRFLEALANAEIKENLLPQQTHLKRIIDLLLDKSMAESKGPVIGVLIRTYIDRGEIETAVKQFCFYSHKYKITPCRQQLTYAVLKTPDLLQLVYATSVAVRGEIDSKHNLAFAKSDVGDFAGASKLLSELGKDMNFIKILKQCEFLGLRREVDKILNLAKAVKMTETNRNCSKMYNIALLSCKRFGDVEGLNRTVAHMQDEDMFVDPEFLKYDKRVL